MGDFTERLPDEVVNIIFSYLGADALENAWHVCRRWRRVAEMLWRARIQHNVRSDPTWGELARRREWIQHLSLAHNRPDTYYGALHEGVEADIRVLDENWRTGQPIVQQVACDSRGERRADPV